MLEKNLLLKIKHFIPWLFGAFKASGYNLMDIDLRDFQYSNLYLGGTPYVPKSDKVLLQTLTVKDQKTFNDCVFNSLITCKEIDEKVVLSVESVVAYASRQGYITGNGFSDLRSGQRCLTDFGAQDQTDFPGEMALINNGDWADYIKAPLNSVKAAVHKSKTYWFVSTKDEIYSLLDQGRPVQIAIPWYSGYNQGGGFAAPWTITKTLGIFGGGHCLSIIGYIKASNIFIIQNSYSSLWGDNGKFYIDADFLINQISGNGYGAIVNLDLDSTTGSFLNSYSGKNVKKSTNPAIYHIQNGTKKLYPDFPTFLAWDGNISGFTTLNAADSAMLDQIPAGDNMDITKSVYWTMVQQLKLADDNQADLVNALIKLQYNRRLGLPLETNL